MGTDIHGGFVKVTKNSEGDIISKTSVETTWTFDRYYTLFAILAGVRNGYGFAGCYRHEPLEPIAEGRGLPDWLTVGMEKADEYGDHVEVGQNYFFEDYSPDIDNGETWLGEHSHTYMTLKEILDWSGWGKYLEQGGVVALEHYKETLAVGKGPERWSGGVWGGSSITLTEKDMFNLSYEDIENLYKDKQVYVAAKWKSSETLREMFDWFLKEINRLAGLHGEDGTYLVIGFDS